MRLILHIREFVAAILCAVSLPLFFDLLLVLVGNLIAFLRPSAAHPQPLLAYPGQLAVLIPAHNEEQMVAHTIASVADSAHAAHPFCSAPERRTQILVIAHNCTDNTAAVAREANASVLELCDDGRDGKSAALRAGFAAARALGCDACAIVDADSTVSPNFIAAIHHALATGAQAMQCRYEQVARSAVTQPNADTIPAGQRLRTLAFRGMNVIRARGRAALGLSCGIFGNGFALTTGLLDRIPYATHSIAEDAEYHAALVTHRISVHWIDHASVTAPLALARAAHDSQEARWEGGRLHVGLRLAPTLAIAIFRGNVTAVEALLAALSLPFSLALALALFVLALPGHWTRIESLFCLLIAVLYLAAAAQASDHPAQDWLALAAAPAFALRKILLLPKILAQSSSHAAWVRTGREPNDHER